MHRGLSLVVLADWYNPAVMKSLRFFDENTQSWWTPVTGGANVPALNELLGPFGVAFGDAVLRGELHIGGSNLPRPSTAVHGLPRPSH